MSIDFLTYPEISFFSVVLQLYCIKKTAHIKILNKGKKVFSKYYSSHPAF